MNSAERTVCKTRPYECVVTGESSARTLMTYQCASEAYIDAMVSSYASQGYRQVTPDARGWRTVFRRSAE